jgi:L,D-transpeptidase ErfK/SrfK
MTFASVLGRAGSAALIAACLSACSLFSLPQRPPPPPPAPVAPPAPVEAAPVATSKFTIAADHDDVVGIVQSTTATKDDTLTDIARRFNVGYEEIVRANPGVDVWLPGAGKQIVLPTQFVLPNAPHEGVVINIAEMRLYYYPRPKKGESQVVYTFPIGIGKVGWKTPEGVTHIVRRQKDPTWRPPVSVIKEHRENGDDLASVIGPGPDNPLGRHAFYLAWPGYLIHGTNKPAGVGLRSSHGCIRLYPEDIALLYDMVPLNTQVRVVNQPVVFGWHAGQLYMQAFGSLEDDTRSSGKNLPRLLKALGPHAQEDLKRRDLVLDPDLMQALAANPRGIPVSVTDPAGGLEQALADALVVQNRLPDGATWDGKTDLPMDDKTFKEMLSDRDPSHPEASDSRTSSAPSGSAPAVRKQGT